MLKQNIGIGNALIRITLGLTVLAWSTAKLSKKPWRESYLIIAFLGAMKVAEGIVRYCPMTDLAKNYSSAGQSRNDGENKSGGSDGNKPQLKQLIDMFIPKQETGTESGQAENRNSQNGSETQSGQNHSTSESNSSGGQNHAHNQSNSDSGNGQV